MGHGHQPSTALLEHQAFTTPRPPTRRGHSTAAERVRTPTSINVASTRWLLTMAVCGARWTARVGTLSPTSFSAESPGWVVASRSVVTRRRRLMSQLRTLAELFGLGAPQPPLFESLVRLCDGDDSDRRRGRHLGRQTTSPCLCIVALLRGKSGLSVSLALE